MTIAELLKKSIDSRNETLWATISNTYNLKIEISPGPNYLTNYKDNQITIYIDQNNCSSASMTHELLHIELKRKNVLISEDLINKIAESEELNYIFSKDLEDHVGNCLEHIKMFDIFINMGYNKQEFLSDFDKKKITNNELQKLKLSYRTNGYFDREAIDFFIGKFFAMKACVNTKFNYIKYYSALKRLDLRLFTSLNEFWEDWLTYSIYDSDDTYDEIIELFIDDLNNWCKKKSII